MFRSIKRSFTEGLKGMLKNGLMTVTSIFVVTSCIFVFSLFLMITFNLNHMADTMAKNYQMDVYIERPVSMDDASYEKYKEEIKSEITKTDNIETDDIGFVTGKKKFADFKETLTTEEREYFASLPEDFLSDSYIVKMKDISKAKETKAALSGIEGVKNVQNNNELGEIIEQAESVVKKVSIWIIVIFALVSLFIISNTIKLTVHNRRKEINIMKYVGATDSYIKGPFIMEGMLVGLFSSIIAFFISQWTYVGLYDTFISEMFNMQAFVGIIPFSQMWPQLLGALVILGCLIGAFGSSISVRRYLKV